VLDPWSSGTQLDLWGGRCFVSVVGFQFVDTRVLGCAIPFHCNFEEVNLRFYVTRIVDGEIRRGVVFIKEIVPRRAIAWVANARYNENYVALPMSHDDTAAGGRRTVSYRWRHRGQWCRLAVTFRASQCFPTRPRRGLPANTTGVTCAATTRRWHQVEHPRWNVWKGTTPELASTSRAVRTVRPA
jgi:uncharacterized protein YqjF (DUF2071 family)